MATVITKQEISASGAVDRDECGHSSSLQSHDGDTRSGHGSGMCPLAYPAQDYLKAIPKEGEIKVKRDR